MFAVCSIDTTEPKAVTVGRLVEWMASSVRSVDKAPCGSVVAVVGVDSQLSKVRSTVDNIVCLDAVLSAVLLLLLLCFPRQCGTLTTRPDLGTIRPLHMVVSPIVRVAVKPAKASNTARMAEALRTLTRTNGSVEYTVDAESGEHVVAGAGELQVEVVLKELARVTEMEIVSSQPVVTHRESITAASSGPYEGGSCLGKSANKHSRLYIRAWPVPEEALAALDAGRLGAGGSGSGSKAVAERVAFASALGVDPKRLWAVGPEQKSSSDSSTDGPTNALVDGTHGLDSLHLIKDLVIAAFYEVWHVVRLVCAVRAVLVE